MTLYIYKFRVKYLIYSPPSINGEWHRSKPSGFPLCFKLDGKVFLNQWLGILFSIFRKTCVQLTNLKRLNFQLVPKYLMHVEHILVIQSPGWNLWKVIYHFILYFICMCSPRFFKLLNQSAKTPDNLFNACIANNGKQTAI